MYLQDMENPGTTMEEYVQFETEKALRNGQVYNYKTATYEMPLIFIIKNLDVPFGIPFDPKMFHKDGACTSIMEAKEMDLAMIDRLRMKYAAIDGQVVFTSHAWRKLFRIHRPLVREIMLEFYSTLREPLRRLRHRLIMFTIAGRGQEPEKVTNTGLFFLRSDV
nr:hypothetical protein [Tanacetum cinerariifolium]